jgi:hypothetical protein
MKARIVLCAGALIAMAGCATDHVGTGISFNTQQGTTIGAAKTAAGKLTKTLVWTLAKTAAEDTLRMFMGDDAAVAFTLVATLTDSVNVVSVAGEVCVGNPGDEPTAGLTIVDTVQSKVGEGNWQGIAGAVLTITPTEQVAPADTVCYPYNIPFTPVENATYRNQASVTITNFEGAGEGTAVGPTVTAEFTIPTEITGEAARTITITDTQAGPFSFTATDTQKADTLTYDAPFTCDADAGENVNTATIVETGVTATATVAVECFALEVAKTAETDYTRTWVWNLEKTSDTAALLIPAGFPYDVSYDVTATAAPTTGDASATGTITVTNPAPFDAVLTALVDTAATGIPLAVTCPDVTFPYTLAAGAALSCTYAGDLPDTEPRTNTATAVLQNHSTDAQGTAAASGTTAFTGSAELTFEGEPSAEYDTCVEVTDDHAGALGTICLTDLPKAFTYAITWGPFQECGEYQGVNTASFVTQDTQATGSSSWTVAVTVPCGPNCTLSQGYWKNHSEYGPAKYDATWALLPHGADQPLFQAGYSWYTSFHQPPTGGDAFIILARQYMAAWLNGLRGANLSDVADDVQRAAELLDEYDGSPTARTMVTGDVRKQFLQIAERLDKFNNGQFGPGKCDED